MRHAQCVWRHVGWRWVACRVAATNLAQRGRSYKCVMKWTFRPKQHAGGVLGGMLGGILGGVWDGDLTQSLTERLPLLNQLQHSMMLVALTREPLDFSDDSVEIIPGLREEMASSKVLALCLGYMYLSPQLLNEGPRSSEDVLRYQRREQHTNCMYGQRAGQITRRTSRHSRTCDRGLVAQ